MRSRLVRVFAFSLISGVVLLGIGYGTVVHQGGTKSLPQAHAQRSKSPVGDWNLIVTFPDGSQESSNMQFGGNGTLQVFTPGPGTGTWSMTSSNQFQYTFTEEILDSQGNQTAYVNVQQQATLSADGRAYTAFGQGTVHAMDATVLAVNPTTTVATLV